MSSPDLTVAEILRWNDSTSSAWLSFISAHPEVLQFSCDIHNSTSVGQVLQHIVAAELRYVERLSELPISDYSAIPYSSADEIFETHHRAISLFSALLSDSSYDWGGRLISTPSPRAALEPDAAQYFTTLYCIAFGTTLNWPP